VAEKHIAGLLLCEHTPCAGTNEIVAYIIVGLATITSSASSIRAEETTAHSSYPLRSENTIPLGDFGKHLSLS
jgi:hypothetical protein